MPSAPAEDPNQAFQLFGAVKEWAGALIATGALGFVWRASSRVSTLETTQTRHGIDIEGLKADMRDAATRSDLAEVKQKVDHAADKTDIADIKGLIRDLTQRVNQKFDGWAEQRASDARQRDKP